MDIWLLLCMGIVFLAVAEYAVILGISKGQRDETIKQKEDKYDLARKLDSWAMKIFIGLYVIIIGTYSYCVFSYAT